MRNPFVFKTGDSWRVTVDGNPFHAEDHRFVSHAEAYGWAYTVARVRNVASDALQGLQ